MRTRSRIFFAGNPFGNGGPWEVNKTYVKHLHGRVSHLTMSHPLLQFPEILLKLLFARVVIFSGVRNIDHLLLPLCRFFHKRMLFIMHGCMAYENEVNRYPNPRGERNEALMLRDADQILCVSEPFRRWVAARYPQYASKTTTLTNGISWELWSSVDTGSQQRAKHRIILLGGGRITKHNLEVCRAVERLNKMGGEQFQIDIYGPYYDNDASSALQSRPYTTWHGSVSHIELLKAMSGASLFIQNSSFEPFSLGVIEALMSGCDVLVTQHVGAIDIIPGLTIDDIIRNPLDYQEIADKIQKVMRVGNNERLLSSIDREATSSQTAAEQLYQTALLLQK